MALKKHQPLAKKKYDKCHPIISIRLTPDLKLELDALMKKGNESVADILAKAVALQLPSIRKSYFSGYKSAQTKYAVNYKCAECGKLLTIDTPNEKEATAKYLKEHHWAHGECIKQ